MLTSLAIKTTTAVETTTTLWHTKHKNNDPLISRSLTHRLIIIIFLLYPLFKHDKV